MIRIVINRGPRSTAALVSVLVLIFTIAGFASGVDGDLPVPARAVELFGTVLVKYAGEEEWNTLFRMERVRDGDRLFTGPDGEVSLKCKDKTLVTLFSRSEMDVEKLALKVFDGKSTAVTKMILSRGTVGIEVNGSGRYRSEVTLTASNIRLVSSGETPGLNAVVEYVPETETVGVVWRGGGGIVTMPAEHSGVVEVMFGVDIVGDVSFSREASPDLEVDAIVMTIAARPMDASVDAIVDRIVIGDDNSVFLSGRTAGGEVSLSFGGEATPIDAAGGFWETEVVVDAGMSLALEPITLGASGSLPNLPAGEEDVADTSRRGGGRSDTSTDDDPLSQKNSGNASRVARSFLSDFIGAVEEGDTADLSGMIEPSYSGIGGSRSGLIGLVRDYFNEVSTLRISWSVVSIDKTEDMVIITITWNSSAGASGVSTFWLSDDPDMSLSHAEGDWFF